MPKGCTGVNRDGRPCSAQPQPGQRVCIWHDASRAQDRAIWRRQGGHGKSNAARAAKRLPADVKDTLSVLLRTLGGLEQGDVEPARATAIAAVARAIILTHETSELEGRLSALEGQAARQQPQGGRIA